MNTRRFLQLVTEHALRSELPLDRELESAGATLISRNRVSRSATDAATAARDGALTAALLLVGVEPLVTDAAIIDPVAAGEVGNAVRKAPRLGPLVLPLALPAFYTALVLIIEINVAAFLLARVVPILDAMARDGLGVPSIRGTAEGSLMLGLVALVCWTAACIAVAIRIWLGGSGVAGIRSLHAARLLRTAAVLARHGHAPSKTVPALARAARLGAADLERLAPAIHDGPSCERSARWLESETERGMSRLASRMKVAGGLLALAVSFGIVAGVYRAIGTIQPIPLGGW